MSGRPRLTPSLLLVDHPVTRLGVRIALDGAVSVCAESDDAEHAISGAQREQPEICLLGFGISGGGIYATREICKVSPNTAVIVLAPTPGVEDLLACVQAGAVGYLSSEISAAALRRAIEAVIGGEAAVSRSMVLPLVRELQGGPTRGEKLTARERQVVGMLRRGQSTAAIADRLGISPVTVRRHISTTVRKTGAEGRAELVQAGPMT